MALVKCPDCGRDVSDQAPACVGCGRPLATFVEPTEVCEVILRLVNDGNWGVSGARWALDAQAMTPEGIKIIESLPYRSGNAMPERQSADPNFTKARQEISRRLLSAGWEALPSLGAGAGLVLPRFQRREAYETDRLMQGTQGTGLGGVILRRVFQTKEGNFGVGIAESGWDVQVDGAKFTKIGRGDTTRLDLSPGNHSIRVRCRWGLDVFKSGLVEAGTEPGVYADLTCGLTKGFLHQVRITLRGTDGSQLAAGDSGKPFRD